MYGCWLWESLFPWDLESGALSLLLGMSLLDFFDFTSNSVLMPIAAIFTCIFVGFVIKPKTLIDEVELNGEFKSKKFYSVMIKYIAPVCLVAILIFAIMEALGMITV